MERPHTVDLDVESVLPGEAATLRAAQASLSGESKGLRGLWPFLGPAFIAAVAYIDPGNFATNIAGGAKYGYLLCWVVVSANLMAMLVQTLSAKLGIATGRNLPETCRDNFRKPVSFGLWVQAEAIAMATDLAEVLGAALGLNLLFGMPLFPAGLLAGAGAFGILALQRYGFRRLEAVIAGLVGVIVVAFAFEVFLAKPSPAETVKHIFVPGFEGSESILLAAGILGATVMPHVVYLHSALTQNRVVGRDETEKKRIQRFERIDVIIAMTIAGFVNLSMLTIAAAVFFGLGIESIEDAYASFDTELGGGAAAPLRGCPARVRLLLVLDRDDVGPGRHAGIHPAADPALPQARDHTLTGADHPGDRRRSRVARSCSARSCSRSGSRSRSFRSSSSRAGASSWGRS